MKKNLQDKFLDRENLSLIDNITLGALRKLSNCDGMCGPDFCKQWYCEVYKQRYGKKVA